MIIFDENIHQQRLMDAVAAWYQGRVISITSLRPGTVIKDDAIPTLLRKVKQPTFVTTNVADFWRRVPAHPRYSIICVMLPSERFQEIPDLLRRLCHLPEFGTRSARMGKVARVSQTRLEYYGVGNGRIHGVMWSG